MYREISKLKIIAREVVMPDWATHVAVSKLESKYHAEPCVWVEEINNYHDEDNTGRENGEWTGCYKECYWHFFDREELEEIKSRPIHINV